MIPFIAEQWKEFGENLDRTAEHVADGDAEWKSTFCSEAMEFQQSHNPETYSDLLKAIADGVSLVQEWKQRAGHEADKSGVKTDAQTNDSSGET